MSLPFISCVCPTYKRPELLRNAIACFEAQNYPKDRCELIVLDDANQFSESEGTNWRLLSTNARFPNLPEKFNYLVSHCVGDVIAVWEDDDVFLPWNLSNVAECHLKKQSEFYIPERVWNTHNQALGCAQTEDSNGFFHSSWRFTRRLFDAVGGYPQTTELAFDLKFRDLLIEASGKSAYYGAALRPSYVYRWGNGYWHGSEKGPEGFTSLWDYVGTLPAVEQGVAYACFDQETKMIFELASQY